MKRNMWVAPSMVFCAVLFSSCATYRIVSDYDTDYDFSGLKTFAWVSNSAQLPEDPRIDNSLMETRVRTAVKKTLTAKGYREASPDTADFQIGYYVNIQEKTDVRSINDYYGYAPGWGWGRTDIQVTRYDEGTLILDVIEPKQKHLIWRGSARSVVRESETPKERDSRVLKAVQKILADFPPE